LGKLDGHVGRISPETLTFSIITILYCIYSLLISIPLTSFWLDEGVYTAAAWLLMKGKHLYSEVGFPYGPVIPILYVGIFKLLAGIHLAASLIYILARVIGRRSWISLLSPLAFYGCVGVFQGARLSASTLAGLWSLVAIVIHLLDIRSPRQYKMFLLGALLGVSILTKHNVALIDLGLHSLILLWRGIRHFSSDGFMFMIQRIVGMYLAVAVAVVGGCYLLGTSPAVFFSQGWKAQMSAQYARIASVPFPWPWHLIKAANISTWLHGLIFYSPWILLLAMILVEPGNFLRNLVNDEKVLLVFVIAYGQYLQMFPLSDMSHYVRATIVFSIIFAYAGDRVICSFASPRKQVRGRAIVYGFAVLLALGLHVSGSLLEQARMVRNIVKDGFPPPSALPYSEYLRKTPREPILAAVTQALRTQPEDKMFIAGSNIVFYLLADKNPALPYCDVTPLSIRSPDEEREVIQAMMDENVLLVLKCPRWTNLPKVSVENLPILWSFIKDNYLTIDTVDGYEIMRHRAHVSPGEGENS
jgi:hypothetical protein